MRFSSFIFKNIRRRPLRSILTVVAVALGVASVVSLVGISTAFKQTFMKLYSEAGIDLLVVKGRVGRQLESGIPESLVEKVQAIDGVANVIPGVNDVISFPEYDLFMVVVNGWVPESFVFEHLQLAKGRFITNQDHRKVNLGSVLANNLNKQVGDQVEVYDGELFEVVGIFDSFSILESGSVVIPMRELQPLIGREDQVLGMSVITSDGNDAELVQRVAADIEALERGIVARPAREHVDSLTEIKLVTAMAWLTSAIALVIGGVGVMNTMIMSVQERTREIGVLRAIGWRRNRIVRMILYEAVSLSVIGAIVGIGAALLLVRLLSQQPAVSGLIETDIPPFVLGTGLTLAVVVGVLGGFLPALVAARMTPTAALRQE